MLPSIAAKQVIAKSLAKEIYSYLWFQNLRVKHRDLRRCEFNSPSYPNI